MTIAASENIDLRDSIVVRPRRALIALGILGSAAFVILGAWMLAAHADNVRALFIGPLAVVFFGWAGFLGAKRFIANWSMIIDPKGFTIAGPTYLSKEVLWRDVEEVGVFEIGLQGFTGVKLKTYANLVPQYSSEEIGRLLARDRWLGRAMVVIPSASTFSSSTDMENAKRATAKADGLEAYFANRRAAYGYDIIFGWPERDRDAASFADLLESFRARFAPRTTNA